jgi:hypothetical protein
MLGKVWMRVSRAVMRPPQKSIEAVQGRVGHRDICGQRHVPWHQPQCQGVRIWQDRIGKISGEQMRQFGLTGPFPDLNNVGDEQQIDHAATSIPARQVALQDLPDLRVFGAGKQVVAVD